MKRERDDTLLVFDFADEDGTPHRACFTNPERVIVARALEEVRPALREVQGAVASGYYAGGYVAYEAAPAFDRALVVREGKGAPLLWFGIFRAPEDSCMMEASGEFCPSGWEPSVDFRTYEKCVAAAREAIARGDTYQLNYTIRLRAAFEGDDLAFYERLASRQCAGYSAYLRTGPRRILSASPELFFRWRGDEIVTRPMKGTAPRGRWLEEDERIAGLLASSEKDRAENVMIVDLLRNDLGRIARVGTVRPAKLFRVERYPTVFQMTSTVSARTREGISLEDVFDALFPCGSVTGAPKVSTMRLIAELEDSPRDVYCGSVGLLKPGGDVIFNVAIRTVVVDVETCEAEYGVGGGITWDSTAGGEYAEVLTKAELLTADWPGFCLLETLRLENGTYALLERHLSRMEESARYFDFSFSADSIRRALASHAEAFPDEPRRVRLLVSGDGEVSVESSALAPLTPGEHLVALAASPVSSAERFLYHKTTHRAVYERHRAERPWAFDVLLWNEEGEVTEFTNGNVVVELDGELLTPPRECGLLAGTMRAELLARGEIKERVIAVSELSRAARLWFINGVRGWVPVRFTEKA